MRKKQKPNPDNKQTQGPGERSPDVVEDALAALAKQQAQRAAQRLELEEEQRRRRELEEAFHNACSFSYYGSDSEFARLWAHTIDALIAVLRARGISSIRDHVPAPVPGMVVAVETLQLALEGVSGEQFALLLGTRLGQLQRFEGPDAQGCDTRNAFRYALRTLRDSVLEERPSIAAPAVAVSNVKPATSESDRQSAVVVEAHSPASNSTGLLEALRAFIGVSTTPDSSVAESPLTDTDRQILGLLADKASRLTTPKIAKEINRDPKSIGKNLAFLRRLKLIDNLRRIGYVITDKGRRALK